MDLLNSEDRQFVHHFYDHVTYWVRRFAERFLCFQLFANKGSEQLSLSSQTAVYGLLGVKPIEQELDLRKLKLLGNILSHKSTLEYEMHKDRWLALTR